MDTLVPMDTLAPTDTLVHIMDTMMHMHTMIHIMGTMTLMDTMTTLMDTTMTLMGTMIQMEINKHPQAIIMRDLHKLHKRIPSLKNFLILMEIIVHNTITLHMDTNPIHTL